MTHEEKADKLVTILNSEKIMTKISNTETKEEMQMVFAENGLDMTLEEVDTFIQAMNSACASEMSEGDLEMVTGGAIDGWWIFEKAMKGAWAIGKGCWNAGRWLAKQGF